MWSGRRHRYRPTRPVDRGDVTVADVEVARRQTGRLPGCKTRTLGPGVVGEPGPSGERPGNVITGGVDLGQGGPVAILRQTESVYRPTAWTKGCPRRGPQPHYLH